MLLSSARLGSALFGCALGLCGANAPAQSPPEGGERSIDVAGARRSYLLHLPDARHAGVPLPVLIVFHAAGGDAAGMARHTGLTTAANARGYAVVYPEGLNRRWNDGRGTRATADDVGFVRLLLDSLRAGLPADPKRIYATGLSNGGGLAFRLACDLSGTFAAVASVAGGLAGSLEERCAGAAPVSVLLFHGTRDPLMPYDGGDLSLGRGRVLSAPDAAATFARVNGCGGPVEVAAEPDTVSDGTRVRRTTFTGCRPGHEVVLFTVHGGGHTWPGGPAVGRAVGRVSRDLDATRAMLDFFDRHPRP